MYVARGHHHRSTERRDRISRQSTGVELTRADARASSAWRHPLRFALGTFAAPLRRFFDKRLIAVQDTLAEHVSAEAHDTRSHLSALTKDQHHVELREEAARIDDLRRFVAASRDANIDAATFVGEVLRDLEERVAELRDTVRASARTPTMGGDIGELDQELAHFLNSAVGHEGYAAQRGLWFNWPLVISYEDQDVRLDSVNERIVELPYVMRATAGLAPGSRIVDVGAAESALALSLATLGFHVVAVDPRGYALAHPNLRVEARALEEWDTDERFDAVLCVSTIEHLGTGEYGESLQRSGADERALDRMLELLEPEGLLVLTTPLGDGGYERARLDELLEDWEIEDFTVAEQTGPAEWCVGESVTDTAAVALVTARRPS
jgi:hypothetical protein